MKKKKNLLVNITAAVGLAALTIFGSALAQQSGIKRTELQRYDLSASGREVVQVRIDFEPGEAFGKHSHTGEEIIYVLEGLIEYDVEGKPPVTLKAGDVLFIPAGTIHAAKNAGTINAAELATYIVVKGKRWSCWLNNVEQKNLQILKRPSHDQFSPPNLFCDWSWAYVRNRFVETSLKT